LGGVSRPLFFSSFDHTLVRMCVRRRWLGVHVEKEKANGFFFRFAAIMRTFRPDRLIPVIVTAKFAMRDLQICGSDVGLLISAAPAGPRDPRSNLPPK